MKGCDSTPARSTSGHFSTGSVHAYIMTTDRGANEVLARKMWNVLAKDAPHILFFTNDCFEHAIHLITLSSLKTIDGLLRRFGKGFKFFSSLATASNTLRDVSKALFEKWCEIHGDKSGMQHAKKLWPKAVGGRWNSITEVEQRMLDIGGMSMMLPVLLEVLKKKDKDKDNKKDLPPNDDVVDEISFDATKQYQRNMGAWRKKTLECAQDPLWWVLSETMRLAQSPGTHVSVSWCQGR